MTDDVSHYDILGASSSASPKELNRCYRAAALKWHPDKNPDNEEATAAFLRVQRAWEVLIDPGLRATYDAGLSAMANGRVSEEVDLDDMHFVEQGAITANAAAAADSSAETYTWPCRCGHGYSITSDMLEQGLDVVSCSGCSLCIRVLFEVADEDEDEVEEELEECGPLTGDAGVTDYAGDGGGAAPPDEPDDVCV